MFKYVLLVVPAAVVYFVFFFEFSLTNETIGDLFVVAILGCLVLFLIFKFGLHYKIQALNKFTISFYYSVFEYKKAQHKSSNLSYKKIVR